MASGYVNRVKRPNTWLHRPMLQNVKKLLPTRSRPHMAHSVSWRSGAPCPELEADRKWLAEAQTVAFDPGCVKTLVRCYDSPVILWGN